MIGIAFVAFVVCCVLPVAYLLATTSAQARRVAPSWRSTAVSAGCCSTRRFSVSARLLLATAIGAPLGIVLARVPLRRKGVCVLSRVRPFCCRPISSRSPGSISGGIGFREWTYSLPAAIVVLSLVSYPLSMLATEVAMRRIDGRLEEAGLIVAPPGRVLRRITLPLVAPVSSPRR